MTKLRLQPIRPAAAPAAAALVLAGLATLAAFADEPPLKEATGQAVATRAATQQQQDAWADERTVLLERWRTAEAEAAWLTQRRDAAAERVAATGGRVAELERRLAEADRLQAGVEDTLQVLVGRLEASIDRSLPFLKDERRTRLDDLRAVLARADVAAAEKLRRVLEALQVEAGYGGTVEVVPDVVTVGGEALHVDVLRVGRVALMWRTPDGERAGCYDPGTAAWTELGAGERRSIGLAVEMASRLRAVEVVNLPLGRLAP
ncbi:MAG TPA: DUF3450 domain-containing protein [Candidatus Krumholzibacteria bacterium]|nr:DUF3450 domain-containing protein [Candidatus Krumholzibacteria bacterium]